MKTKLSAFALTALLLPMLSFAQLYQSENMRDGVLRSGFVYDNADFPSCHAATVVETDRGEIMIALFGGLHEGNSDSSIWTSHLTGGRWTDPVLVADGTVDGVKTACWNPVLFQVPGGELLLFYKVGIYVQAWEGYVMRSTDGGYTWSEPELLPGDFLGPVKNKPILRGGELLCGSSLERGGWRTYIERTGPDCRQWTKTGPLNDRKSDIQLIQPAFLVLADSSLKVLCRSVDAAGNIVSVTSRDNGRTWERPRITALPGNDSGIDAQTLTDGRHMVVYNHITPSLNGTAARSPINVAISPDSEKWYAALTLEESPGDEYSYPSMIQASDGTVHIVYTWHRKFIKHVQLDPSGIRTTETDLIHDEIWPVPTLDLTPLKAESEGAPGFFADLRHHGRGVDEISAGGLRFAYAGQALAVNDKTTEYPPLLSLAACGDGHFAFLAGAAMAQDARQHGVDVILGPELTVGPNGEVLTDAELAVNYIRGARMSGVPAMPVFRDNGITDPDAAAGLFGRIIEQEAPYGFVIRWNRDYESPQGFIGFLRSGFSYDGLFIARAADGDENVENLYTMGFDMVIPRPGYDTRQWADGTVNLPQDDRRAAETAARVEALAAAANGADDDDPDNFALNTTGIAASLAEAGTVLLKNDGEVLPLQSSKILVMGDGAYINSPRSRLFGPKPLRQTALFDELGRGGSGLDARFVPRSRRVIDLTARGEFTCGEGDGMRAQYFEGGGFAGQPVMVTTDNAVDFSWGDRPPVPGDRFSVRWSGVYAPSEDALVLFNISGTGRYAVKIDGLAVASDDTGPWCGLVKQGERYNVVVEYEADGEVNDIMFSYDITPLAVARQYGPGADAVVLVLEGGLTDEVERFWVELATSLNSRVIVVLQSCDPSGRSWSALPSAILNVWYPGQEGGRAITDILTGRYRPAAKLPIPFMGYPAGYGLSYNR